MREQFGGDEDKDEKELLAHDEHILVDDRRVQVEKEIKHKHTQSRIRVSFKRKVFEI